VFRIQSGPLNLDEVVAAVAGPEEGGTAVFLGTVREGNAGRRVLWLEYEAYPEMAEKAMALIGEEIRSRFGPATRVAMIHRVGRVEIGEAAVIVAAATPHRDEAFAACRMAIERLKGEVPIWKKEVFEGGEIWVDNCAHEVRGRGDLHETPLRNEHPGAEPPLDPPGGNRAP